MKQITLLLIAILISLGIYAQTEITPAQVIFNSGNNKITLKQAKTEGTTLTPNIELEVVFSKSELDKLDASNVSFEFRWFYYMSTRKSLMATNTVNIDLKDETINENGLIRVKSEKKNVRKGWWEVQVKCRTNDSQIEFAGVKDFSILLK